MLFEKGEQLRMKIEQIKQVLEIHKTGSINKAAHNLFIAQSSLSTSMRALEKELGQKIFVRNKHGVHETEYGKEFIQLCIEMMETYQKMQTLAAEKRIPQQKKKFCISISYLDFAVRVFIEIYNEYRDINTEFQFHECSRSKIVDAVAKGDSELGIVAMPSIRKTQWLELFAANGLEYFRLSTEEAKIFMREDHPLALGQKNFLSFGDLKEYSLFFYDEDNEIFNSINKSIIEKYQIKHYIRFSGKSALKEMLYKTDGYLLGAYNKNAYHHHKYGENIRVFDLNEENLHYYELGYVKKIGAPLSELGQKYIQKLTNTLNNV